MGCFVPDHYIETADLILTCSDGQELLTHSCLLCLCSPVIRGMCESLGQGKLPDKLTVAEPSQDWKKVLPYLYPNVTPNPLTWANVGDIIEIAHKYDMQHILQGCTKFLETTGVALSYDRTQPNYVLKWLEISSRLHLTDQQQRCVQFFRTYSRHIVNNTDWYCQAPNCQQPGSYQPSAQLSCMYCKTPRPDGVVPPANDKEWLSKLSVEVLVELLGF